MNRREKILTACVGLLVGTAVIYGLANRLIVAPRRRYLQRAETLRAENERLAARNRALAKYKARFAVLRNRTFHDEPLRAGVLVAAWIRQLATQAGISEHRFTANTTTGRKQRGRFQEIACNVRARARLERMTNFLYLLARDPHLHRVSSLSVSPQHNGGEVQFTLRYATLVLDQRLAVKDIPPRPAGQRFEPASLNDKQRAVYDVIARRNIFLPYVPRRRAPTTPRPPRRTPTPTPSTPSPPGSDDELVVVGLPAHAGVPQVHVARPGHPVGKPLKVGDPLAGGTIAMVDYRVLPMPQDPKRKSTARVIVKIQRDYWAIELGQRLGDRRILRPRDLPPRLRPGAVENSAAIATRPARET